MPSNNEALLDHGQRSADESVEVCGRSRVVENCPKGKLSVPPYGRVTPRWIQSAQMKGKTREILSKWWQPKDMKQHAKGRAVN